MKSRGSKHLQGSEINAAKEILANEATAMCRGEEAAKAAAETARKTFADGAAGDDLPEITSDEPSISILDALVSLNFASSKKDARRLIAGGGARVDDIVIADENAVISARTEGVKISAGKKKHGILRFS